MASARDDDSQLTRRNVVRGLAAFPLAAALTGCAAAISGEARAGAIARRGAGTSPSAPATTPTSHTPTSELGDDDAPEAAAPSDNSVDNPFGVEALSSIEAVVFNGGYGYDYVDFAAQQVAKHHPDLHLDFTVSPTTSVSTTVAPRLVGGNPPDLLDNSGMDGIGIADAYLLLSDLDDVFDATNYEGARIADTLFSGVRAPGTIDGRLVAINYVMTTYAVWYSGSLFEANGWTPPRTWDETIDLGAKAQRKGKYLFVWGREAATYYQTLAVDSAIKEGGDEVRLALENLESGCWSHPALQAVFRAMETCISKGYFVPGGADTVFSDAQAQWSNDQAALLYPSGSWIEGEMADRTKEGFDMRCFPTMVVSDSPAMPFESTRAGAGEPFIVPTDARNTAGGKELLRAMLSKDAAAYFARTRRAIPIVSGAVPEDGFGSTALMSQSDLLRAAGDNVFNHRFVDNYGMNSDQLVVWNAFLSGDIAAKALTAGLQQITDTIADDDFIDKISVPN